MTLLRNAILVEIREMFRFKAMQALVTCVLIYPLSCTKEHQTVPLVAIEGSKHIGLHRGGTQASIELVVPNTAKIPVKIKDVKTSCGCTVPSEAKLDIIPAGGKLQLPIKWSLPERPGETSTSVTVVLEPVARELTYTLVATIPNTHPIEIDLGKIGPAPTAVETSVVLHPFPGESALEFKEIITSSSNVEVLKLSRTGDDGMEAVIRIQASKVGPLTEFMDIITNDSVHPKKTVSLTGKVIDEIDMDADEVYLGVVKPHKPQKAILNLRSVNGRAVRVQCTNQDRLLEKGLLLTFSEDQSAPQVAIETTGDIFAAEESVLQEEVARIDFILDQKTIQKDIKIFYLVQR